MYTFCLFQILNLINDGMSVCCRPAAAAKALTMLGLIVSL